MSKIIFVYKAKSDLLSKSIDWFHKLASPQTYACELCQLTHHQFGAKQKFRDWAFQAPFEIEFQYEDQWISQNTRQTLPLIAFQHKDQIDVILLADEIEQCITLDELIANINEKLVLHTQKLQ